MSITMSLRITLVIACAMLLAYGQRVESAVAPNVVEVTASHDAKANKHMFVTDAEEIPSGWTTFRLINASPSVHFLVLELLPEGKTAADSVDEVLPVFQQAMDLINDGQAEQGYAKLGELPKWFGEVRFMGGPGLVSPGRTAEVTVFLSPGNYAMECYVKTAAGKFHSILGMFRALTVTAERSKAEPPSQIDMEMTLTNEGFGTQEALGAGTHTIAVNFAEENPPLLGNDVHLVKLGADTNLEDVAAWMDWSQPRGMVSDHAAALPFTFVGGAQEMPMGSTAYFTVELTPGRYAWIGERPANDPLYEEFTVAEPATANDSRPPTSKVGDISVRPIEHASFVLEAGDLRIAVDPVIDGHSEALADVDLVLVTDIHGDHFNADTLRVLMRSGAAIVAPAAVAEKMDEDLRASTHTLANGEKTILRGVRVQAIPMYNLTEGRLKFHPKGRGNGYVLGLNGLRIYVAGDTEGTPEMRALENIDIAFVPMNLPYTMDVPQAADTVIEMRPRIVYPYHYRSQDGLSDVARFAKLVHAAAPDIEVRQLDWYPGHQAPGP